MKILPEIADYIGNILKLPFGKKYKFCDLSERKDKEKRIIFLSSDIFDISFKDGAFEEVTQLCRINIKYIYDKYKKEYLFYEPLLYMGDCPTQFELVILMKKKEKKDEENRKKIKSKISEGSTSEG